MVTRKQDNKQSHNNHFKQRKMPSQCLTESDLYSTTIIYFPANEYARKHDASRNSICQATVLYKVQKVQKFLKIPKIQKYFRKTAWQSLHSTDNIS